jgi:chromosomal replication initiation ATPase DnaA
MVISNKELNNLFQTLGETISLKGVEHTIRALRNYQEPIEKEAIDGLINSIITLICEVYEISRDELIYGNSKSGNRVIALESASHILAHYLDMSNVDISERLNKHPSIISRYLSNVSDYDENHIVDKQKIFLLNKTLHQMKVLNLIS